MSDSTQPHLSLSCNRVCCLTLILHLTLYSHTERSGRKFVFASVPLPLQVAIKKVLQDKRFKNRELQIMKMVDHPNIVKLKHCFYSHTEKDETYLHLVLEYVPDTVYRISKHYAKNNQRMPNLFVKLYVYQMCRALAAIHRTGICHRDIKVSI